MDNMARRPFDDGRQLNQYLDKMSQPVFKPMDKQQMLQYLKDLKTMTDNLQMRRKQLYVQLETIESFIKANTFSGVLGEFAASKYKSGDTVYKILQRTNEDMEQQLDYVSQELLQILRQEEQIRYIQKCIRMLPAAQEDIIMELFINGSDWETYGKERYLSRTTVFRNKKRALENLTVVYNANLKNLL